MRWLWRMLILLAVLAMWQSLDNNPKGQAVSGYVADKVKVEVKYWQEQVQDLPASLEAEIRRWFGEFKPDGTGEEV